MKLVPIALAGILTVVFSIQVDANAYRLMSNDETVADSEEANAELLGANTDAPAPPDTDALSAVLLSPLDVPVYYFVGDTLLLQLTAKADVSLRAIRLAPIGLPNAVFKPAAACEVAGELRDNKRDDLVLAAGRSVLVSCPLEPRKTWMGVAFGIISKGAKANAIVQVEKAEGEGFTWEVERVAFDIQPIFLSPLLGAILGATMLAFFSQLGPKSTRMGLVRAVATGGLVAMILMFGLSAFSGDGTGNLPINVSIVDFRGGVLVGIFAHVLRAQIAEKLHLLPPPKPNAGEPLR